ncbi:hypothetical protein CC2G_006597 [Coprinopsis cinerea AmutBmut pab1-1]|nr:hypothetical protein CC2G_006597 [Coprinopsis cinerea AmutBmut pab1-1]
MKFDMFLSARKASPASCTLSLENAVTSSPGPHHQNQNTIGAVATTSTSTTKSSATPAMRAALEVVSASVTSAVSSLQATISSSTSTSTSTSTPTSASTSVSSSASTLPPLKPIPTAPSPPKSPRHALLKRLPLPSLPLSTSSLFNSGRMARNKMLERVKADGSSGLGRKKRSSSAPGMRRVSAPASCSSPLASESSSSTSSSMSSSDSTGEAGAGGDVQSRPVARRKRSVTLTAIPIPSGYTMYPTPPTPSSSPAGADPVAFPSSPSSSARVEEHGAADGNGDVVMGEVGSGVGETTYTNTPAPSVSVVAAVEEPPRKRVRRCSTSIGGTSSSLISSSSSTSMAPAPALVRPPSPAPPVPASEVLARERQPSPPPPPPSSSSYLNVSSYLRFQASIYHTILLASDGIHSSTSSSSSSSTANSSTPHTNTHSEQSNQQQQLRRRSSLFDDDDYDDLLNSSYSHSSYTMEDGYQRRLALQKLDKKLLMRIYLQLLIKGLGGRILRVGNGFGGMGGGGVGGGSSGSGSSSETSSKSGGRSIDTGSSSGNGGGGVRLATGEMCSLGNEVSLKRSLGSVLGLDEDQKTTMGRGDGDEDAMDIDSASPEEEEDNHPPPRPGSPTPYDEQTESCSTPASASSPEASSPSESSLPSESSIPLHSSLAMEPERPTTPPKPIYDEPEITLIGQPFPSYAHAIAFILLKLRSGNRNGNRRGRRSSRSRSPEHVEASDGMGEEEETRSGERVKKAGVVVVPSPLRFCFTPRYDHDDGEGGNGWFRGCGEDIYMDEDQQHYLDDRYRHCDDDRRRREEEELEMEMLVELEMEMAYGGYGCEDNGDGDGCCGLGCGGDLCGCVSGGMNHDGRDGEGGDEEDEEWRMLKRQMARRDLSAQSQSPTPLPTAAPSPTRVVDPPTRVLDQPPPPPPPPQASITTPQVQVPSFRSVTRRLQYARSAVASKVYPGASSRGGKSSPLNLDTKTSPLKSSATTTTRQGITTANVGPPRRLPRRSRSMSRAPPSVALRCEAKPLSMAEDAMMVDDEPLYPPGLGTPDSLGFPPPAYPGGLSTTTYTPLGALKTATTTGCRTPGKSTTTTSISRSPPGLSTSTLCASLNATVVESILKRKLGGDGGDGRAAGERGGEKVESYDAGKGEKGVGGEKVVRRVLGRVDVNVGAGNRVDVSVTHAPSAVGGTWL